MKTETQTKINAAIGATIGTVVPLALLAKKRKVTNLLKMDYKAVDMLILSSSSIIAGTAAGTIGQSQKVKRQKVNEGIFQFFNATIPTIAVSAGLKICEKSKKINNNLGKLAATSIGLIGGMLGAAEISNKIVDPQDRVPDREINLKDCIANADDVVGALTLAKFPLIKSLHIDKVLPAIFAYCGYRAGTNTDKKQAH